MEGRNEFLNTTGGILIIFTAMKSRVLILGLAVAIAVLAFGLQALNHHYMVRDIGMELYSGAVAALFLVFGLWIGNKVLNKKEVERQPEKTAAEPTLISTNPQTAFQNGLTARELEVLQLIAQGHSNQEIADKLFVSLNTVKTHSSNLFIKLDVKRRTQAVQKAKQLNLIS